MISIRPPHLARTVQGIGDWKFVFRKNVLLSSSSNGTYKWFANHRISATNNEIMCCAHGDNCNDGPESYGPHEKQFYQHRRLKKLEHALFYVLCFFFLFVFFGVFLFWWKPSEVSALFNACCKQWAQRYSQQPNYIMANSHEPYNNREETTNGYSTNVTYINDMPDDSGSGQGNTICTQRTIARQTRIIERSV